MILKEVGINDLERLVRVGFEGDEGLLKNQQFDTPMEETIRRNIENVIEANGKVKLKFFEVVNVDKVIGFTIVDIGESMLYSFGISAKERTKEVVIMWFIELKKVFNGFFYTTLHNNNKRAIEFLKRNGMIIFEQDDFYTKLIYY